VLFEYWLIPLTTADYDFQEATLEFVALVCGKSSQVPPLACNRATSPQEGEPGLSPQAGLHLLLCFPHCNFWQFSLLQKSSNSPTRVSVFEAVLPLVQLSNALVSLGAERPDSRLCSVPATSHL